MAAALKHNRTLIHLNLWGNSIRDAAAKELLAALQDNYTLTALNLTASYSYGISDTMADEINATLKRNVTLRDGMHEAIKKGNVSAVKQFLQQGVSLLAVPWSENNTALHWAVIAKQYQMVAYLLQVMRQQGLPLDTRNQDNQTAADLAKGTKVETLFTVVTSSGHIKPTYTSKFSIHDKHNMAYTAPQSFMPPLNDQKSEATKTNQDNYLPRSKL